MMGVGLEPELIFYLEGVSVSREKTALYHPRRAEPEPVARMCIYAT